KGCPYMCKRREVELWQGAYALGMHLAAGCTRDRPGRQVWHAARMTIAAHTSRWNGKASFGSSAAHLSPHLLKGIKEPLNDRTGHLSLDIVPPPLLAVRLEINAT